MKYTVRIMTISGDGRNATSELSISRNTQAEAIEHALKDEAAHELEPDETLAIYAMPAEDADTGGPRISFEGFPRPDHSDEGRRAWLQNAIANERDDALGRKLKTQWQEQLDKLHAAHPEWSKVKDTVR